MGTRFKIPEECFSLTARNPPIVHLEIISGFGQSLGVWGTGVACNPDTNLFGKQPFSVQVLRYGTT